VTIVPCTLERHGAAILDIFNDAIRNTTALYEYRPRTPESMVAWFRAKTDGRFPVLGAEDDAGTLLGFATYGTFRPHAAYKYTVEHSVYVDARHRGGGVGEALLRALVDDARGRGYHVLVGGIDAANDASIRLHAKLGFTPCGVVRQVGFKFGGWLDLAFYQLVLEGPADPVDG
jgi:phosphinothricin acetyltransferase